MKTRVLSSLLATVPVLGCHVASPPQELPAALAPGAQLFAFAPDTLECAVTAAPDAATLAQGQGTPLAQTGKFKSAVPLRVLGADAESGWVLVRTQVAATGERVLLRVPAGQVSPCLSTDPRPIVAAAERAGKTFAYRPWGATCSAINAAGTAAGAILVEADPGQLFNVTRLRYGASAADAYAKKGAGGALWYELNGGLSVRADTFEGCFGPAAAESEGAAPALAELLGTPLERCAEEDADRHVECRTTLGVWEGTVAQDFVSIARRRRTLGTLHFVGGKPVEGAQFARTVVAFDVEHSPDESVNELARSLNGGISRALSQQSEGEIRLARPGESAVTNRVTLRVSNLRIGELSQRDVQEATRYKSGEKVVENPAKAPAQARVIAAEDQLRQAEQEYEEAKQQLQEQKDAAIRACNEQKEAASGDAKTALAVGCSAAEIGATFVTADRSAVTSAQQELSDARQHDANTPDTLTEDIMSDWTFTKHLYERKAEATLELVFTAQDGTSRTDTVQFQEVWSDFDVENDPAHGVQGHQADRGPINDPRALLAPIGQQMSAALAKRLTVELAHAARDQARKAFIEAGNEPTKPGYEDVDAEAFSIAGTRLKRVQLRSRTTLVPESPIELPTASMPLGPDECVLAVAVAEREAGNVRLVLGTRDFEHGDVRRKSKAAVELCPGDLGAHPIASLFLSAEKGDAGAVRWALYRTRQQPGRQP